MRKVLLEVDARSFGNDARAWSNLNIIANRIVGAFSEVGQDQMGKDAIDHDVKRVVIAETADGAEDMVELKKQTLYVHTSGSDKGHDGAPERHRLRARKSAPDRAHGHSLK